MSFSDKVAACVIVAIAVLSLVAQEAETYRGYRSGFRSSYRSYRSSFRYRSRISVSSHSGSSGGDTGATVGGIIGVVFVVFVVIGVTIAIIVAALFCRRWCMPREEPSNGVVLENRLAAARNFDWSHAYDNEKAVERQAVHDPALCPDPAPLAGAAPVPLGPAFNPAPVPDAPPPAYGEVVLAGDNAGDTQPGPIGFEGVTSQ